MMIRNAITFRNLGFLRERSLFVLLLIMGASIIEPSHAKDHFVPASVTTVDCKTFGGGISPGDTITLAAGERGAIVIRSCRGTLTSPIMLRNDSLGDRPTIIRNASARSGGFVFDCVDCQNFVIDGTGRWSGAQEGAYCGAPAGRNGCGIRITVAGAGDEPSVFMRLGGLSTRVSVRGVEIDGRWPALGSKGIGIYQNDHSILASNHPGFWREGFLYENNFVHGVHGEGMYLGPNWREPDLRVPLRDIIVRQNLIENTGRENIDLKSAISGTNRIHHNVVRNSGLRGEDGQQGAGIKVFEGGANVKIHHNWVEAAGMQGIIHYNMNIPPAGNAFTSEIYNNVIISAGTISGAAHGHGISVGFAAESAPTTATVYHNTIVSAHGSGINFSQRVSGGSVADNIVVDSGGTPIAIRENTALNNIVTDINLAGFIDPGNQNFSVKRDSPAVDAGKFSKFPNDDFRGVQRPRGLAPDIGAFEFVDSLPEPKSPLPVQVE